MVVWAGRITFDNSTRVVDDIHFNLGSNSTLSDLDVNADLLFLSVVDVSAIPLHRVTGPLLDVWAYSGATEQWLTQCLLGKWSSEEADKFAEPWWHHNPSQSNRGILLRVMGSEKCSAKEPCKISEVLIYAGVSENPGQISSLLTPPRSSSPSAGDYKFEQVSKQSLLDIKIFALPLCPSSIDNGKLNQLLDYQECHGFLNDAEARFLSLDGEAAREYWMSISKRQRITTKFDDATFQRKRLIRRGGESISKTMAAIDGHISHQTPFFPCNDHNVKNSQLTDQQEGQHAKRKINRSLSRTFSTISSQSNESAQPISKREAARFSKRSSLHRVESTVSIQESSPALGDENNFEERNKSALSRIVMTGMRIYGLQQRKKSSNANLESEMWNDSPMLNSTYPPEDEYEYKLVYHQTLKAALFTFRAHLAREIINQGTLRDVVDRFLAIFCNDPILDRVIDHGFDVNLRNESTVSRVFDPPARTTAKLTANATCSMPTTG